MCRTGELTVADTLNKEDFINLLSTGIKNGVEEALAAKEVEATESRDDTNTQEAEDASELKKQMEQMNATIMKLQQEKQQSQFNNMNPEMMGNMYHPMMMPHHYIPN